MGFMTLYWYNGKARRLTRGKICFILLRLVLALADVEFDLAARRRNTSQTGDPNVRQCPVGFLHEYAAATHTQAFRPHDNPIGVPRYVSAGCLGAYWLYGLSDCPVSAPLAFIQYFGGPARSARGRFCASGDAVRTRHRLVAHE